MTGCDQELCPNWAGDGGCPCAVLGILRGHERDDEWRDTDREICPQPCEHLSQHDAREGRTCPEHPCTCTGARAMAEHDHITKTDTLGCPACDKLEGRDRVPAPMPEQPTMPDLSAFPSAQHRIEGGKFICPGDENAWCHQYPEDDCDHEYWPCGHEFTSHAECWIKPWIDATDLADSYAGVEHELVLRDEDFPDGDVDWTWEGEYVTFDYAPDRENGSDHG